jgi:LPXTG-site transpeptidase (sortase) family protein
MKKFFAALLAITLCAGISAPIMAADYPYATNYTFGSGPDSKTTFGKPTGYDEPARRDPLSTNTRRNKDAAVYAPAYGVFSGDIPTDPTSPYHTQKEPDPWGESVVIISDSLAADTSVTSGGMSSGSYTGSAGGGFFAGSADGGVSIGSFSASADGGSSSISTTYTDQPGLLPSTSVTAALNTSPWYYDDGSIGSIYITKLNKTICIYEGESLENMQKGLGHFSSTSAWDGNVGLAGHNRGAAAYFSFVKDLETGDKITYKTRYGERTYRITSKEKISETDLSSLGWSGENKLTLITCVENTPELRWCVVCTEE